MIFSPDAVMRCLTTSSAMYVNTSPVKKKPISNKRKQYMLWHCNKQLKLTSRSNTRIGGSFSYVINRSVVPWASWVCTNIQFTESNCLNFNINIMAHAGVNCHTSTGTGINEVEMLSSRLSCPATTAWTDRKSCDDWLTGVPSISLIYDNEPVNIELSWWETRSFLTSVTRSCCVIPNESTSASVYFRYISCGSCWVAKSCSRYPNL